MTPNRAEVLTRYLKKYDKRLEAKWSEPHMIHILFSDAQVNRLVMSLTDTWAASGNPVPWGIEPVLLRLRQIDVSGNEDHLKQIREQRERKKESEKRDFKNHLEAGLLENRKAFADAFEDYNLSIVDKKTDKRRIKGA